jgi:hypothetical protein
MLIFAVVVICGVFAFVAGTALRGNLHNSGTCTVADIDRIDCGYFGISQAQCESKGCCWVSSSISNVPWCFYQSGYNPTCFKYQV